MQLLAVGGAMAWLLSGTQATVFAVLGLAVVTGAGLAIASKNNYFIKRPINKLTKKLEKVNDKIRANEFVLTESKLNSLNKTKQKLETEICNKLTKAYNTVKFKPKRLEKFMSYVDTHAEKYPYLFNTFGENVDNLKQLLETVVLQKTNSSPVHYTSLSNDEQITKEKQALKTLSADDLIYREEVNQDVSELEI